MRAPLSVIIPTLNAASSLQNTAASLIEGLDNGLIRELIISDGGSEDETALVADKLGAALTTGPPSRGAQLARGATSARGDWMLFLHADTRLSKGWTGAVRQHIQTQPNSAAYFKLQFAASGLSARIVAGWANIRSQVFSLPYGDQGLLISRTLYDETGGYQNIPLMEDVSLTRALRGRIRVLEIFALTSPDKYLKQGWFHRGASNFWILLLFFWGVAPDKLARKYTQ